MDQCHGDCLLCVFFLFRKDNFGIVMHRPSPVKPGMTAGSEKSGLVLFPGESGPNETC